MDWVERARARARALKLNYETIAERVGVTTGTIGHWFTRRREPETLESFRSLARALEMSLTELLGGEAREEWPVYGNLAPAARVIRQVPHISWIQAGNWCPITDPYPPGAAESYVGVDIKVSDSAFALTVRGDSMINPNTGEGFPEGCIIVVDPGEEPRHGHYVVVRLDDSDEATFKQLVVDGSKRYLRPLNPRYPIIEINGNASICGVVKKMIIEKNF